MSKETEPIRSRRQLREQSAHTTGAPGESAAPAGTAPVAPAPAAPPQTPQDFETVPQRERDSQIRARDRAALRTYKGLVDPPELSPLPSRKALRQAQLEAERAPITAVNPVVSVTATVRKSPAAPLTLQGPAVALSSAETADSNAAGSVANTVQATSSAPGSVSASEPDLVAGPAPGPATAPVAGLRSRAGRRAAPVAADKSAGGTSSGDAAGAAALGTTESAPASAGARKLPSPPATKPGNAPVAAGLTEGAAAEGVSESAVADNAVPKGSEDGSALTGSALADSDANVPPVPGLIPGGNYYPVSAGPPLAPGPEELAALTAKRAEAERAAILAQRAQARERLAQENVKNSRPPADPTATNNLAMVTPMEFIEVPGSERPMMRPPTTMHVPIVTRSTPRQSPAAPARPAMMEASANAEARATATDTTAAVTDASVSARNTGAQNLGAPVPAPAVPNINAERFDAAIAARDVHRPGPGKRPLTGGRSSTLKRAEAMAAVDHGAPAIRPAVQAAWEVAEPVPVQRSQMPPMPADYAHGMEPLDAMTAGLRRTQRNLLIQWGSIVLGGAAFVAGVIVVLTNILN